MGVVDLRAVGIQGMRVKRRGRRFKNVPNLVGSQNLKPFWVIRNVTMELQPGDVLVLVDPKGTRQDAVMRMLCGLLVADEGQVSGPRRGLMVGPPKLRFVRAMSVSQSIRLLGGLYGMTDTEIDERYEGIVDFAEVGRLLSRAIEDVDSDVLKQLAFAVATSAPVELVGLDRMAVVGSPAFRGKCLPHLRELTRAGAAIVVVSSDPELVHAIGTRALLLQKGGAKEISVEQAVDKVRELGAKKREMRRARRDAALDWDEEDDERGF